MSVHNSITKNLLHHQRQINELGTAAIGPVSVGPGEGSIRFYTDTGDNFSVSPSGASVKYGGSMAALSPLLEAHQADIDTRATKVYVDGNVTTLLQNDADLRTADANLKTYVDGNVTTIVGRLDGHDGTLSSHSTRISTAQSTANGAVSDAAAAQSTANSAKSAAAAAQSDANTANSTNSTQASQIDALQSKVSNLQSQVSGSADAGTVSNLNQDIQTLKAKVVDLESWLVRNTPYPNDYPNPGA